MKKSDIIKSFKKFSYFNVYANKCETDENYVNNLVSMNFNSEADLFLYVMNN